MSSRGALLIVKQSASAYWCFLTLEVPENADFSSISNIYGLNGKQSATHLFYWDCESLVWSYLIVSGCVSLFPLNISKRLNSSSDVLILGSYSQEWTNALKPAPRSGRSHVLQVICLSSENNKIMLHNSLLHHGSYAAPTNLKYYLSVNRKINQTTNVLSVHSSSYFHKAK